MYTNNNSRYSRGGSNSGSGQSRSGSGFRRFSNNPQSRGDSGSSRRRGGRKMPTFNPAQFINKNPVETISEIYTPTNTFSSFGLNDRLVQTLKMLGIITPSPIQDQIIPEILQGRDVIGIAETGTGKTAAFLLPLIEKTLQEPKRQTLILTPTRELAIQIENELRTLSRDLRMFSTTCVGGTSIQPQIRSLGRLNHFIIGTPGRVLDLINRGYLQSRYVTTVVLDEADRMLDMGFINDIRSILDTTPKERETLFFSATTSKEATKLVNDFLKNPITISVKKKDVTNSIEQDVVTHKDDDKFDILLNLLKDLDLKRVIIFGAMKHSVETLAQQLSANNVKSTSIHGNKNHTQRQRALSEFKNGNARVLVATDVAARGIHVDNVSHVINYDLPNTFEDYVHRIGRTGRGSKQGKALTFIPKTR